ncbi:hypothetical protein BFJ66_g15051 [Fusarium oxysporum f. sp. cepae]|nr:hypothetical protein BFJ66_g15051 [Fusarium oxysporum f. sp. cepae]
MGFKRCDMLDRRKMLVEGTGFFKFDVGTGYASSGGMKDDRAETLSYSKVKTTPSLRLLSYFKACCGPCRGIC